MSLVITIIVVIILAMIFVPGSSRMPDEANYANFAEEVNNIEEGVQQIRLNNAAKGDTEEKINAGFKKVTLINAPSEFQSFDSTGITSTGYVVDLEAIKYENAEFGHEYEIETSELEFTKEDVYVYDSTGTVFYVKGTNYQNEIIHRPFDSIAGLTSTEDGPIISNITISSGELADGTPTSAKAKVTISAFPRYGGKLTVMLREIIAEEQPDGTFTTQVSRNGIYTLVVEEENGGRTVQKVNISGIIEVDTLPSNLSMIVNNGNPNVTSTMVNIVVRADGAEKMIIAKNNPLKPTSSDERWVDYETNFTYDLGSEEGRMTLYAWFKNEYSNVTDKIVKATIIYDKTPPSAAAPQLTISGPYIIVETSQKDNISPDSYLLSKTEYGYKIHNGGIAGEEDYTWSVGKLIGPLVNGETYDFVTRTEDEVGHKTVSQVTSQKIKFDYLINFDLNGAIGTVESVYVEAGNSITVPTPESVREGYSFIGWSEKQNTTPADVTDIIYDGETYLPTGNDTTKTLYAVWSPRTDMTYTVNHYVEKIGTMGEYELKLTETFNNGTVGDAVIAIPKEDGEFVGYIENLSHSQRVGTAEVKGDGSTVLKLYYNRAKFDLIVKGENATTVGTAVEVPYESEVTISATPNEGYEFERWIIEGIPVSSPEYANFVCESGDRNPNATFKMLGQTTTLIAKTRLKRYTITYNLNGGTPTGENPTEFDKSTPAFTLHNPIKTGYDFAGWSGTGLKENSLNVTINPAEMPLMDREYEALFTPSEDLLTITATPTEPTNGTVRAIIACLDNELRVEYRVGTTGTWDMYASSIAIDENTVVYARATKDGNIIDEESLVINNIDKELPVIEDVSISHSWTPGSKLNVKVTATDNIRIDGYAVTNTETTPRKEEFTDSNEDLELDEEVNYVWVMDIAGNVACQKVYAWDISTNGDRKVYALLKNEKEIVIDGTGETRSYQENNVPYREHKSKIEIVKVEGDVESIGNHVLSAMGNVRGISIPKSLNKIEENALIYTNNFEVIEIETGNTSFKYDNYSLYDYDKTQLYIHSAADPTLEYTVPATVTTIKNHAFYDNDNLSAVIVSSNPILESNVFEECSELYMISGDVGGTSIGKEAFLHCENLHLLDISDTLLSIGENAFSDTYKLGIIELPKTITNVVNAETSKPGVFRHIGIYSQNIYNQGIVRYYQSCQPMYDYAHKYNTEAYFDMIDDVKPEAISLEITSPESGIHAQEQQIVFTAKFSETLGIVENYTVPSLKIRIGEGDVIEVQSMGISGDKIEYIYMIDADDLGDITLVSYSGRIYDLSENYNDIVISELGGSNISINTVVQLSEADTVSYHSSIQKAINAMTTTEASLVLLKDTEESVIIKANTQVMLNLNSNTLNNTNESPAITNNGTLTLMDGSINSVNTSILSKTNSKVSLYNVEIETTGLGQSTINTEESSRLSIITSTINGKSTLIDVNGNLELMSSELYSESDCAIKVKNGGAVDITNATLLVDNGYGIDIFNDASVSVSDTSVECINGTAINNEGNINVYGTSVIKGAIGINSSGIVNFYDGTIEGTDADKAAVENLGTFEIHYGRIESSMGIAVQNRSGIFKGIYAQISTTGTNKDAVKNSSDATFEYGSGDITSKDGYALVNLGNATLQDNAKLTSTGVGVIDNKYVLIANKANIDVNSDTGTAIINTGTYTDNESSITGKGIVGIENKVSGSVTLNGTNMELNNTVGPVTGVLTSSTSKFDLRDANIIVKGTAGIATGIKLEQDSIVNVYDTTVTATSTTTTSYGVNNYKGTFTMGEDDGVIAKILPSMEGGDYGYYSTDGILAYYDGRFIGAENKSLEGNVTYQPPVSFILYNVVDGREYTELTYDVWEPTDVILVADKTEWTNETIVLTGSAKDQGSGIAKYAITTSSKIPTEDEWITLEEPVEEFTVTQNVEEWAKFYLHVMDLSSNYVVSNYVEAKYDAEPPEIIGISSDPSSWTSGDVIVNVEVRDSVSGVIGYEFNKTSHDLTVKGDSYAEVAPIKLGTITYVTDINETLHIYMYDQAGNVSYRTYIVDNVDDTAPTINVEFVEYGESSVKVKITAKDEDAGVKDIFVDGVAQTLDGISTEKYVTVEITKDGITEVLAQDNIMNESRENIETYVIVYDPVNGTGTMPNQIKLKDTPIEILENQFVREGYVFANWNTANDYTGTEYRGGDLYNENENVTLYANWKDVESPKIHDIYVSENWTQGNDFLLEIDATDNIAVTGYQITTTNVTPTTWGTSSEVLVSLENETYYIWTKDDAGNVTSTEIKVFDVSETTSPKTVIGILKDIDEDGEYVLSIEGKGKAKDITANENKPWNAYIDSITSLEIRDGINEIGEYILGDLSVVDEIKISSTITKIALSSFAHTNNYSTITIDGSNYVVSNGMLMDVTNKTVYMASTKVTTGNVALPATVENIGLYAFENSTITSIYISKNIDIKEGTFYNAKNLKDINSDNQIGGKSIGNSAFEGCLSLEFVNLSDDLEVLGSRAFYGTTKLNGITIGKKVTSLLGNQIFTNIGINAGTDTGKGYVYYYDSNALMFSYANSPLTKDQATFIGIDDVLPEVTEVIINKGAEITNDFALDVEITATDNRKVTGIFITTDGTIEPKAETVTWITPSAYGEYKYILPEVTGDYTLYVWARDEAGNVSATPVNADITLAVYNFELNTDMITVQYVDTTGKDYYEYRDNGYTLDNPDIDLEITGTVNHKALGTYDINYKLSYKGKHIETKIKRVFVIANSWETSEFVQGDYRYVFHAEERFVKVVGYTNTSGTTELKFPESIIYNEVPYDVIDVGNNTSSIIATDNLIEKVTLPNGFIAVSDYAFSGFKKLSNIEYGKNLMTIGEYAFANSNGIYSNVTIKNNVREVKNGAFENTIIDEIVIESGVKSIQEKAFYTQRGVFNNKTLNIPSTIDHIGMGAFAGYKANNIVVDSVNEKYASIFDLVLTNKEKTDILQYAIGNLETEYIVPAGIINIAGYAFAESDNLQKIKLDDATTRIGEKAFKNAKKLTTIENVDQLTIIENEAFMNTALASFEISENINQLDARVFKNTKLKNVYVPSNVSLIGSETFASNADLEYVIMDAAPTINGDTFKNSEKLGYLIALDENTIMNLDTDLDLPSLTTLYVTSKEIETAYEQDARWETLGIYRIKCLAELIGDEEIITVDKEVYTELGIILLEEEFYTGEGTSSVIPLLTVDCESDVNNEIAGIYHVTYYVRYNGNLEMTLVRTISVVDEIAPVIADVITSTAWSVGSMLKVDVIASDNKDYVLSYAVTNTADTTSATWNEDPRVTLIGEINYIHVKDKAGNIATIVVKAWDISANTDKTIYAYEKESGELVATGSGMTTSYLAYGETPWKDDNEKITKLTIEEGIIYTGDYIFSDLENVSEISLPSTLGNVIDISISSFAGTNNFVTLTLASGNKALKLDGTYTLVDDESRIIYVHSRRDPATTYTISSSKEIIAENAFYKNNNIKSVDMNNYVEIGASAFEGCLNLESINGEIGNTKIGTAAFSGDVNLKDITISSSVTDLGTGIFTNVPGPVYYYASCPAMKEYAKTYPTETLFIMIDNVGASDTMPTLKASSSIIVATSNQVDEDGGIVKVEYIIRENGKEYNEDDWQVENYFKKLNAGTKYYVKTRATDLGGNVVESREATITTKQVPDSINITAVPAGPTSGDVDVVIEWPIADMDLLYGNGWPEGTTVTKQVGIKTANDSSIRWTDVTNEDPTYTYIATENGVIVYARLFDGTNYTSQTISLSVGNIDRIAPTGSVIINDGEEEVLQKTVTLTLAATDNRNDTGFGVKYYYASESPTIDDEIAVWREYSDGVKYAFEFSGGTEVKTVYVWYKDAAENISAVCSDSIMVITHNVMLEQNGETTYYMNLQEAIDNAEDNPTNASKITIIKPLAQDGPYAVPESKNIVLDMNGRNITQTDGNGFELITNSGLLTIINSKNDLATIQAVSNTGTVTGILNYGYLEINGVSITADSPDGTSIGISNISILNEENLYYITYVLDGGTLAEGTRKTYSELSEDIIIGEPTKEGHTFIGWTGSNGGTPEKTVTIPSGSTGDKTYIANWEVNTYSFEIVYESSTGVNLGNSEITMNYGETEIIAPPIKEGYITPKSQRITMDTSGRTITFIYEPVNYNVIINCNGGSGISSTSYTIESETFTIGEPTRNGYTFLGWTGSNGSVPETSITIENGSIGERTYTANWLGDAYTYNIEYKSISGVDLGTSTETHEFGTTNTIIAPEKAGYTTPASQDIVWDSTTPKTITFKYQPIRYTVTFDCNGGSGVLDTSYTVETSTFVLGTPTRAGYIFAGWTGSNGETPETSVSIIKGSTGDKNYTANWTGRGYAYNVIYKSTTDVDLGSITVSYDYGTTNTITAPDKAGYKTPVSQDVEWDSTTPKTITFIYEPINYDITIDCNGGSDVDSTSYTVETETFTLGTPIREGYKFIGWTGSNGNEPQTTVTIAKGSVGVKTYIANWAPASYSITISCNGGSGVSSTSYTIETPTFEIGTPTRNGYAFEGWTGSNGETPEISVIIENGSMGARSYTANWIPVNYGITIDCNEGSGVSDMEYTIETPTFTLGMPTRPGYTFIGWTGSNGETPELAVTIATGSTGVRSYTANWSAKTYNITIDCDGGSGVEDTTYTPETETFTLGTPTKAGYTFTGWTGSNGETPEISVSIVKGSTGDKSYTANWKANKMYIYENGTFGTNEDGITYSIATVSDGEGAGSVTQNSNYMNWTCSHSTVSMFYVTPKVDCSGFSTLNISIKDAQLNLDGDYSIYWGLASRTSRDIYEDNPYVALTKDAGDYSYHYDGGSISSRTISVDISSVNDAEYYVALWIWADGQSYFNIDKIWLE